MNVITYNTELSGNVFFSQGINRLDAQHVARYVVNENAWAIAWATGLVLQTELTVLGAFCVFVGLTCI